MLNAQQCVCVVNIRWAFCDPGEWKKFLSRWDLFSLSFGSISLVIFRQNMYPCMTRFYFKPFDCTTIHLHIQLHSYVALRSIQHVFLFICSYFLNFFFHFNIWIKWQSNGTFHRQIYVIVLYISEYSLRISQIKYFCFWSCRDQVTEWISVITFRPANRKS